MKSTSSPEKRWASLRESARAAEGTADCAAAARIQREVASLISEGRLPPHVRPLKIAWLRSVTVEPMIPLLAAAFAARDFAATVELGQLGNHLSEMLSAGSFLDKGGFDACLVLLPFETVVAGAGDPSAQWNDVAEAMQPFFQCLDALASRFRGLIVVCNFAPSGYVLARRFQSHNPASSRYAVCQANRLLASFAQSRRHVVISDLERLSQQMGTDHLYSSRDMATVLQPFSAAGFQRLCRDWAELCSIYFRGTPKCIVLDCDGTLWGGIVGEDGIHGIRLGETYPGLCYQQFQRQLKQLKELGFLLAIDSKNNEDDVRAVFERHPGMILKYDDFSAVRVNWNDKAANLAEIAEELNVGVDSLLFVDDSVFELERVKSSHPGVTCLQVPEEIWKLPELLPAAGGLDRLSLTQEDRGKAEMYAQERRRKTLRESAPSLDDYLRQLDLEMTIEGFAEERHLDRAVQLLQKTNQFNLTTRRHGKSEITGLVKAGALVYLASLRDRFGAYGRIALAIVVFAEDTPVLDTFLMSCRAIGRKVETVFLEFLLKKLRALGHPRLLASFAPTDRNQVAAGFLAEHGFRLLGTDAHNVRTYERLLEKTGGNAASLYHLVAEEET